MPIIERVSARRLWDGRGRPTLEAEVWLRSGGVGRAVAGSPTRGIGGAAQLRDGGPAFGGAGVQAAITAIREDIAEALHGLDCRDQETVDRAMIAADGTPDKSRLGGNALHAVSLAVARARAAHAGEPLWKHLAGGAEPERMPLPVIEVLGQAPALAGTRGPAGVASVGVVATGAETLAMALDWSAEVVRALDAALAHHGARLGVSRGGGFVSPFDDPAEALDTVTRAIAKAGFAPGEDVGIALDVGAGAFGGGGRYVLGPDGAGLDAPGMNVHLLEWLGRFPIAVIEDPLAPDGGAAWPALTRAAGAGVAVVGGDLLASDGRRVRVAAEAGACNAIRVEPADAGTLTEAKAAVVAARAAGWRLMVSCGAGTGGDTWPAELAVAWGADLVRAGGLLDGAPGLNELIRIATRSPRGGRLPQPGW